jgi:heterotetrameric sarcosine oxidase gamma subunit
MSAQVGSAPEMRIGVCDAGLVELAALRGQEERLSGLLGAGGINLPACGRAARHDGALVIAVRPARWLLLEAPSAPGAGAAAWREACCGAAAVIDLSAALQGLHVEGTMAREALTRGCRLDLDPQVFPAGHAAATIIAQVPAILAALPSGMLILTPASTARYLREWLAAVARPFGLAPADDVTVAALTGDSDS